MAGLAPRKLPKMGQVGYADREERVDTIAAGIIDKNSPLMRRAASQGLALANRRGLINSSIAAGASQNAVLDQAIPMASQTASQNAARNQSAQGYMQDRDAQYDAFRQARSGQERSLADGAVQNIYGQYESRVQSIMANPNLSATERASQLQAAKGLVNNRMAFTKSVYGNAFDWPSNLFAR